MQFAIDVHLHSRFARATSRDLNPSNLHKWSALKGVDVVADQQVAFAGGQKRIALL